jgi:acetamidase/formamidase
VPLAPFLGCVGVAPAASEVRTTIVPGPFGGNMDCPEVRAGNTVFLGVNVPGALLSFGDGHYAMGEGEIIGAAIEGAMRVEVFVELVKRAATPVPRIENADEVMFVGSGRPLEDAARVAFKAMVGWVRERSGLAELDAYQFVSQVARAPIVQIVDPEYTVLVKIEKARVPGLTSPAARART